MQITTSLSGLAIYDSFSRIFVSNHLEIFREAIYKQRVVIRQAQSSKVGSGTYLILRYPRATIRRNSAWLPLGSWPEVDCKTVVLLLLLFFSFSKSIWCGVRVALRASSAPQTPLGRIFNVSSQSRSPFSASLQAFCLTVRAYLNNQKYGLICSLGLGKQATFRDANNISMSILANDGWGTSTKIPCSWRITIDYPDLAVHLIGRAARKICFNESDALPRSGKWRIINMPEFLRLFLRLHSQANQWTVGSRNVDCFLRLLIVCQMMVSILKKQTNKQTNKQKA